MRTGLVIAVGILVAVLLVVSNGGGVDGMIRAPPRSKLSMMTGLRQTGRAGHRFTPSPSQGLQQDHPAQEEDHSQWIVERMSLSPPFPFGRVFSLPNFRSEMHAVISENYVRLTPDRQAKSGGVWSIMPISSSEFEVMYEFSISGSGLNAFGEGMAFWMAKAPEGQESAPKNNFGWYPRWTGLGIFLDTYDNNGDFAQPSITAVWNDGSFDFHHDSDGLMSRQLGNCKLKEPIRNKDKPSRMVVTYSGQQNTIEIRIRFPDGEWQKCIDTDLTIPDSFEFDVGVSAQTGQIADNHDLVSIKFYDFSASVVASSSRAGKILAPATVHHHYESDMDNDDLDEGFEDSSLFLTIILYLFGIFLVCALIVFVVIWFQKRRSNSRRGGRFSPLPN
ncbi:MAG: legume-like lectin family protein [archaeon]|nr:legume-like lectin family protein [archaeon]